MEAADDNTPLDVEVYNLGQEVNLADKAGFKNVVQKYTGVKDWNRSKQEFFDWFEKVKIKGKVVADFAALRQELMLGKKPCEVWKNHRFLNRYNDMVCFDETRVILRDGLQPDYIHANYVPGYERDKAYVITQAPVAATIPDFWRMVWQENVVTIVMLTHLLELGKNKCERYFPLSNEEDYRSGIFRISLLKCERRHLCRAALFRLTNLLTREHRYVAHVGYVAWPDRGIPEKMDTFRKFVNYVRLINVNMAKLNSVPLVYKNIRGPPLVIHCSAGIGRSAVYALSDLATDMLNHSDFKDPLQMVNDMRQCRFHAVHTKIQLLFFYSYIIDLAQHKRYKLLRKTSKPSAAEPKSVASQCIN